MCYRYAVLHGLKTFGTTVRKWARPLTAFPTSRFQTSDWQLQCRAVLRDIYSHLCLTDMAAIRRPSLNQAQGLSTCHVYLRGGD